MNKPEQVDFIQPSQNCQNKIKEHLAQIELKYVRPFFVKQVEQDSDQSEQPEYIDTQIGQDPNESFHKADELISARDSSAQTSI